MYVTRIPNRDSPPAVLLRESYREGGKVKSRTLANISDWPEAKIDSLRRVLAGETLAPLGAERFEIARALAHGHVAAVLGAVRRLGLDKVLPNGPERRARLILAMIVARIIEPAPKLATARQLSEATAAHSLGAVLGLGEVDEDELYAALDLLGRSQAGVEKVLAQRHLEDGVLVLYDVTSSYLEGRRCELAQFGYSRDHRPDRPQIVFGLLCTPEGCPVAVEVFEGNLGEHARQSGAQAAHSLSAEGDRAMIRPSSNSTAFARPLSRKNSKEGVGEIALTTPFHASDAALPRPADIISPPSGRRDDRGSKGGDPSRRPHRRAATTGGILRHPANLVAITTAPSTPMTKKVHGRDRRQAAC